MNVSCENCGHSFLLSNADVINGVACPECGGDRLERDQPSPTHSDFEVRNDVDPATQLDQGGNPNQEGIWATVDGGWQPIQRRDESFASVRTANGDEPPHHTPPSHVFRMPAGMLHNGVMAPLRFLDTWINGRSVRDDDHWREIYMKYGNPRSPDYGSEIEVGVHHPGHEQAAREIIANGAQCAGMSPATKAAAPSFWDLGAQVMSGQAPPELIPPGIAAPGTRQGSVHVAWDFGDTEVEPTHHFIISGGRVYAAPVTDDPNVPDAVKHHEEIADRHGLHDFGFPKGMTLGTLNDDGSTQFYQHEGSEDANQLADLLTTHFGQEVTIDPGLRPTTNEERWGLQPARTRGRPVPPEKRELNIMNRPRPGNPFGEREWALRGGALSMEPHMPWTHQAVTEKEAFAWLLPAAARILPFVAKPLMKGVVKGVGNFLMGDDEQQQQPVHPGAAPVTAISRVADVETPHSVPDLIEDHDPQEVDQQEFNDGDMDPAFNNPNLDAEGPASAKGEDAVRQKIEFHPESPAVKKALELLPSLIEAYHSSDSGLNDPLIRQLHEEFEKEIPGYLDHDDPDDDRIVQEFLQTLKQQDGVTAAFVDPYLESRPDPLGVGNQQPQQQAGTVCGFCGAQNVQAADGTCQRCGKKPTPQGVVPPQQAGFPPNAAAAHQGPVTDEQKAAMADLLLQQGRHDEIPDMLLNPDQYADLLEQIQGDDQTIPPTVDPNEQPPPAPPMDPSMMGMPPGMPPGAMPPGPGGMPMIGKVAADSLAPRCTKCNSATTGFISDDGDCRCHACGNIWKPDGVQKAKHGRRWRTVEALEHEHPGNVDALPAADQEEQRDIEKEQDSSLSFQDVDGQPLQVGQEYELHNPSYQIPDIVRIEAVKPDGITITTTGEYSPSSEGTSQGLEYTHEISREEVDLEGLTFVPSSGTDEATPTAADPANDGVGQTVNTEPVSTPDVPGYRAHVAATTDELAAHAFQRISSDGGITIDLRGAEPKEGYAFSPYPELERVIPLEAFDTSHVAQYIEDNREALAQPGNHLGGWVSDGNVFLDISHIGPPSEDTIKEAAQAQQQAVFDLSTGREIPTGVTPDRNITSSWEDGCPACGYTHVTASMISPTKKEYECFRCAAKATVDEANMGSDEGLDQRDWLMNSGDVLEVSPRALAMANAGASRNLADIAARDPRLTKVKEILDDNKRTAGKKYTPREQREFIDEDGVARNADRLNLSGTHYEIRHETLGKAIPDRAPDTHMGFI